MQVIHAKKRESSPKPPESPPLDTQQNPSYISTSFEPPPKNKGGRPRKHTTEAGTPGVPTSAQYDQAPKNSGRSTFPRPTGGVTQKRFENFIKYWQSLTPAMCSRVRVHVYRNWPVIDRVLSGEKVRSITVFQEDPALGTKGTCHYDLENWKQQVLHEFGSGDYKYILCELGVSGAVAICDYVTVRDPMIPPKLNLKELVKGDKLNADYIESLRRQGIKLPGDEGYKQEEEEDNDMAGSNELIRNLTEQVVNLAQRPAPVAPIPPKSPDDVATHRSIELVANAANRAGEIVQAAQSQAAALQGKQVDPLQMLSAMGEVVEKISPKKNDSDILLKLLFEQAERAEARNQEMQREMRELQARRDREDVERRDRDEANRIRLEELRAQELRERLEREKPKTLVEQLREKNEIDELLGVKKRRSSSDGDDDGEGKKESMLDNIIKYTPLIVSGLTTLATLGANVVYNMRLKPGEQPQPVPMEATAAVQQQTQALASGQTPEQQAEQAQLNAFLQQIEGPLITHFFSSDLDGHTFAHHIYTSHPMNGPIQYMQMKQSGKDMLLHILSTYPPIWSKVGGLPQQLDKFADEFMEYDEWKTQQTADPDPYDDEDDETTSPVKHPQPN